MKKTDKPKILSVLLIMIFGLVIVSVTLAATQYFNPTDYYKIDLVRIDGTQTVVAAHGCTALVADTTEERADSIRLGLDDKIVERPNSHDIYVQTLKNFNITVESSVIEGFDGTYYYANLIVKNNDKVIKMDAKPSDAIAIALRAKAPIYISKELLDKEGRNIC